MSEKARKAIEEVTEAARLFRQVQDERDEARATVKQLRELLGRTYKAAVKPEWEEGECLNEVLLDVLFASQEEPQPTDTEGE